MLNKDYTSGIQNAIRNSLSLDFTPVKNKLDNLPNIVSEGLTDWDKSQKRQAYIDALESGDTEAQDKALAAYNPEAYANVLTAREQRQQALEDAQVERDFKKELLDLQTQRALQLEGIRQGNAMKLAEFKAGLDGNTTAQKNISYLQSLGYSPEEAAALYYSGNNPTLNMANFGKKAQEKLGTETGKNYAEDINAYNNMVSKMPELMDTVSRLNELGQNATYTKGGQLLDVIRRETGMSPRQSAVDRAAYISMIDNQILPLLRDTFGAQFTEREGNTLRKTLGDANSTPEEKAAQLDAFIRQKQMSIESQKRKLDSYKQPSLAQFQTPVDWSKASDEDLLKGL